MGLVGLFHQARRESHVTQELAEAVIAISTENEIPFFRAWGTILRGWTLSQTGQIEEGIVQVRQGLDAYRTAGAYVLRSYLLSLLVETYGKAGQVEEGLSVLTEALVVVDKTEERVWEAELYRLKGELLLMGGKADAEVEACFHKAIEVARYQNAKSLELRAGRW